MIWAGLSVSGCGAQVRFPRLAGPVSPLFLALLGLAVACLVGGCAPKQAQPKSASPSHASSAGASVAKPLPPEAKRGSRSHQVATLAARALGPFVAQGPDGGGLVAWIARPDQEAREGQQLLVVPVAADGAPLRSPRAVAQVPQEATSLVVESTGLVHGGWFVAWSAILDRGESLTVLGLTPDGAVRGSAVEVERTEDHIQWVKIVPTSGGALCVWAEETPAGDANILTTSIDIEGHPRGLPARVARGVAGWQAVRAGDGIGLALVAMGPLGDGPPAGTLTWQRLDAEGRPAGPSAVVSTKGTVGSDVEVVPTEDEWIMAWTDRTGEDPRVMLAAVDARGRVRGPTPAMSAVGGSSVVALAAGSRGVVLAWQQPHARLRSELELNLARVTEAALSAQPMSSLAIAPGQRPELVATASGFALLAPARACLAEFGVRCPEKIVPSFVRLGARLEVLQTEPLFIGDDGDPATIGWGLRCRDVDRCFAFAAPSTTPTPIYAVDLPPRSSPYAAPLPPAGRADAPRVTGVETIASGQEYDDLAAVRLGPSTLVATMTNALDVPRSSRRTRGAKVTLDLVDDDGHLLAPARTLTSRALSAGGIALAAGPAADPRAAVAWIARRGSAPEVDVALIDRSGQSLREVHLTGMNGDASNVAVAWAKTGWIIAWVDDRDGNGDVYAARLDPDLTRAGPDQQIRRAPGDASDLALAVGDDVAWIAWSDPRESPREGVSDIFASTLRLEDAARTGDEVRVLSSALHSRSPRLVTTSDGGALVAWIEEAPAGIDAPGAAMVARLDRTARVVGAPSALPLPPHERVTEVALEREIDEVRAVVVDASPDGLSMTALRLAENGASKTDLSDLLDLDAPGSFQVALALAGSSMVFSDIGGSPSDRRVRHASVQWKR